MTRHYTEVQGQKIIRFVFRTSIRNLKLILLSKNSHYRFGDRTTSGTRTWGNCSHIKHLSLITYHKSILSLHLTLSNHYFAIHSSPSNSISNIFQFYNNWYGLELLILGPVPNRTMNQEDVKPLLVLK